MKTNRNGVKLLAAVAVFAMVFACTAVIVDSNVDAAVPTPDPVYTGKVVIIDAGGVEGEAQDLTQALIDEMAIGETMKLVTDITTNVSLKFSTENITLDGNGKTIKAVASEIFTGEYIPNASGAIYVLNITKSMTVEDLTVDSIGKAFGVNVATSATDAVTINKVTSKNSAGAGFVFGYANVNATELLVEDAVWGGVNLDNNAELTIENLDGIGSIYTENAIEPTFTGEDYVAPIEISADGSWSAYTSNPEYATSFIDEHYTDDNAAAVTVTMNSSDVSFEIAAGKTVENLIIANGDNQVNITGKLDADAAFSVNEEQIVLKDLAVTGEEPSVILSGNITLDGKVKIPNATVDNAAISVTEDALIDVPAFLGSTAVEYADGAVVKIRDLEYTVYNKTLTTSLGNSVKFAIGIAIADPEYDGEEVTLRDLSPQVILMGVSYPDGVDGSAYTANVRFDAALTEIVNKPAVDVNDPESPYKVIVAVEINYNCDGVGNVSNYFYPTASFNIISPTADIELSMDGWNVNIGYDADENAPEFIYKLKNFTFTQDSEDLPFTVQYFLINGDGNKFPQSEWNSITDEGTYTLRAEFGEWMDGNYAACSKEIEIVLTAGTVDSEMEFSETEVEDFYGMPNYRVQKDVVVTQGEDTATVTIFGTVYYIENFPGFWGEMENKAGYYVAFDATPLKQNENSTVVIVNGDSTKTFTGFEYDGYFIVYLGNETLITSIDITYDVDGNGPLYNPTTYTVNLSGLDSAEYQNIIVLADEKNATEEIIVSSDDLIFNIGESEYLWLPNTAGGVSWITETGVSYAAGALVQITDDLDVDNDGKIVFTADYSADVPEEPETPAATQFEVYINKTSNGTNVLIYGVDGYIPEGVSIEVTYTYSVFVDGVGYISMDEKVPVNDLILDGSSVISQPVNMPAFNAAYYAAFVTLTFGDYTISSSAIVL